MPLIKLTKEEALQLIYNDCLEVTLGNNNLEVKLKHQNLYLVESMCKRFLMTHADCILSRVICPALAPSKALCLLQNTINDV